MSRHYEAAAKRSSAGSFDTAGGEIIEPGTPPTKNSDHFAKSSAEVQTPSDSAQNWGVCYIPSMTRTEAIAKITATLPQLSDERVQTLAEIAQGWTDDAARPAEDDATRAAIANGITQGRRGEFATDAEVAKAYARFRE